MTVELAATTYRPTRTGTLREEPEYRMGRTQRDCGSKAPPWPETRQDRIRVQGWHDRDKELR